MATAQAVVTNERLGEVQAGNPAFFHSTPHQSPAPPAAPCFCANRQFRRPSRLGALPKAVWAMELTTSRESAHANQPGGPKVGGATAQRCRGAGQMGGST